MEQSRRCNRPLFVPDSPFLIEKESAPKLLTGPPKAEWSSAGADTKGQKKQAKIAPLQPPTLATFRSWGSLTGAGRIRLAVANISHYAFRNFIRKFFLEKD